MCHICGLMMRCACRRAGIRVRGLWEGMQRQGGGGGNGPAPLGPNGVPVNVHDMVRDQVRASLRCGQSHSHFVCTPAAGTMLYAHCCIHACISRSPGIGCQTLSLLSQIAFVTESSAIDRSYQAS